MELSASLRKHQTQDSGGKRQLGRHKNDVPELMGVGFPLPTPDMFYGWEHLGGSLLTISQMSEK